MDFYSFNVYMKKVILHNKLGIPDIVYVFTGTDEILPKEEMFSSKEIAELELHKTTIKQLNSFIHDDDSIKTIKRKLLNVIGPKNIGYEELYLFFPEPLDVEPISFYNQITNNGKNNIRGFNFGQILCNCGFEEKNTKNIPYKNDYYYSDILSLEINKINTYKPLGIEFSEYYDFNFSGNPFNILQTDNPTYENKGANVLMYMENQLLFNYYSGSTIHLICAEQLLDFCIENDFYEKYIIDLYFPLLNKQNIENKSQLLEERNKLIANNSKNTKPELFNNFDNINFLHNVSKSNTEELNYLIRGIENIDFVLHNNKKIVLPLESIFKAIHTDNNINIIKYNPGKNKENVYRIYTTQSTKTGKKIPTLPKSQIISISKQSDKLNSITFYTRVKDKSINISIDKNSNFIFNVSFKQGRSIANTEAFISKYYNIISSILNELLLQTGFNVPNFTSLSQDNIEINDIKYNITFESPKQLPYSDCNPLFSLIFDIISESSNKNEVVLNYKRVKNYKSMDAINKIIYDNYKNNQNERELIKILIQNYEYTEKAAIEKVTNFFNNFNRVRGKYINYNIDIVENPGFTTVMNYVPFDNNISFTFSKIDDINYLKFIKIYMDSIFRILLKPETIEIDSNIIKEKCTKKVQTVDDEDIMVVTNETSPINIVPMNFIDKEVDIDQEDSDIIFFDDDDEDEEDDNDDGIFFDDDDEDEEIIGGANTDSDDSDESDSDEYESDEDESDEDEQKGGKHELDGESITNPNIFYEQLRKRDPKLFLTNTSGKFKSYSRTCPFSEVRQPIILSNEEKENIDKNHPGSYTHSIEYGSDPNNKFHYICPRYWCLLNNTSLTQEEVDSGMCGKVIPDGSKTIPTGHYVYEFNSNHHIDDTTKEYKPYAPGFQDPQKSHPDGLCVPCCFKEWNSKKQKERRDTCLLGNKPEDKNVVTHHIIGPEKFPLDENRFGFLPVSLEKFLKINYNNVTIKNNKSLLRKNIITLLRLGTEQSDNKSIIGCIAELDKCIRRYPGKKMTIDEFCHSIVKSVTIDDFIVYNNGSLMSQFKTSSKKIPNIDINKYVDSNLYKSLNLKNAVQNDFLNECIISFENFRKFIVDPKSVIDHTFIWDLVCHEQQKILIEPINLIILEFENNDITNNVSVVCPTNAYSKNVFDPRKRSMVLLKRNEFYEMITIVQNTFDKKSNLINPNVCIKHNYRVTELFKHNGNIMNTLDKIMNVILNNTKQKCSPLQSIVKTYQFKQNINAETILDYFNKTNKQQFQYEINSQVINYQGKVIALIIRSDVDNIQFYLPCYPSSILLEKDNKDNNKLKPLFPIKTIDDDLWNNYQKTKTQLTNLHNKDNNILSKPMFKVIEDGLIVGIITQTNQFVQTIPPQENIEDDLEILYESNHLIADKSLILDKKGDKERIKINKNINLETNFYNSFRNIVRILLHKSLNRDILEKIAYYISEPKYYYKHKIQKIAKIVEYLIEKHVQFVDYDDNVFEELNDIYTCFDNPNEKSYCTLQNDEFMFQVPSIHLISGKPNKTVYLNRIADEFVRNKDISQFLMDVDNVLRIPESIYKVNDDEFILLQSLIQTQYFDNLKPFSNTSYSTLNNYNSAQPQISQHYSNVITSQETDDNTDNICVDKINPKISNKWKKHFSSELSEVIFKNNIECSYSVIQYITSKNNNSELTIQDIKNILVEQYEKYFEKYGSAILYALKKQGKQNMIIDVEQNKISLSNLILSEHYFISDLDIVMIVDKLNIPVVLYANSELKFHRKSNYIILGNKNQTEKHYFIYTPNKTNQVHAYTIINSPIFMNDLIDFDMEGIKKSVIKVRDMLTNIIT